MNHRAYENIMYQKIHRGRHQISSASFRKWAVDRDRGEASNWREVRKVHRRGSHTLSQPHTNTSETQYDRLDCNKVSLGIPLWKKCWRHMCLHPQSAWNTYWAWENIVKVLRTQILSHMHTNPALVTSSTRRPNCVGCYVSYGGNRNVPCLLSGVEKLQTDTETHMQSGPGGCGRGCWNAGGITYRKPIIYLATREGRCVCDCDGARACLCGIFGGQ